jgi:hypothetical protein
MKRIYITCPVVRFLAVYQSEREGGIGKRSGTVILFE